jgi:hypothetical protein
MKIDDNETATYDYGIINDAIILFDDLKCSEDPLYMGPTVACRSESCMNGTISLFLLYFCCMRDSFIKDVTTILAVSCPFYGSLAYSAYI